MAATKWGQEHVFDIQAIHQSASCYLQVMLPLPRGIHHKDMTRRCLDSAVMRVRVYLADESLRPIKGWGLGGGKGEEVNKYQLPPQG